MKQKTAVGKEETVMGSVILEAKSVTKKFDERNVLNEVSLSVEKSSVIFLSPAYPVTYEQNG